MSTDPSPHRERKRQRRANVAGGRQHRHVVKVSAIEEGRLAVLAAQQAVTIPRLLVESALALGDAGGVADRRVAIETLFDLRRSLAGIANNVNQIAYHANANEGEILNECEATLRAVRGMADEVNETLESMRR